MQKVYLLFDYLKEAFHVNRENRRLYRPQVILILVKAVMLITAGISFYTWFSNTDFYSFNDRDALHLVLTYGLTIMGFVIACSIISVIIESGLYNMYKKAVLNGSTTDGDFAEGVKKYFFKFLLGDLLIAIAWIVISPFYILLGIITLSIGLTVIPIIISIFLTMWKVSLVFNDSGIMDAINDSFKFAKQNFFPLTVIQLIHWAFIKGMAGNPSSSVSGNIGNIFNYRNTANNPFGPFSGKMPGNSINADVVLRAVKIIIAVLIPVISIAAIAASLVRMVFEIFFSLVLFIIYRRKFQAAEEVVVGEVYDDVV